MGRTPCCEKNNGLKKGPWTTEEDQKLIDYIQKHGYGNWRTLPKNAGLQRCGKSCRLRWTNYLRPDIKRGRFSFEEEETIIQLHSILGNKWSAIASRLPGRTDNEIKNYWNTHIRKRLLRMGIDPVTHSPRLDLLDLSSILCSSLYGSSTSSQMNNFQNLLNMQQPLVMNPELLKLASSLFTTSSHQQDYSNNQNQPFNPQTQNQIPLSNFGQFQDQVPQVPNSNANVCTTTFTTPCVSSSMPNESHLFEPKVESYTSNFNDLSNYHYQQHFVHDIENWNENGFGLSTLKEEEYVPQLSSQNYYYGSDNQNFMYQNSNQILSTPSSSTPTPLNSNSTCILGSNTEDERESYDSCNRLNFEIPSHILESNDFM